MSIEALAGKQDSEKVLKTEAERKAEIARELAFRNEKEALFAELDRKKELQFLKSLVERGLIDVGTAKVISEDRELSGEALRGIFERIDEIEAVPEIDRILPKELRLTREEYARALEDPANRAQAVTKLESALAFLARGFSASQPSPMRLFQSFFSILNRNLIAVQGHTVDIRRSLD